MLNNIIPSFNFRNRVKLLEHDGPIGGETGSAIDDTPVRAPDSFLIESKVIAHSIGAVKGMEGIPEEAIGRVEVSMEGGPIPTLNEKNAAEDLGAVATNLVNFPMKFVDPESTEYRTEFRPKQGIHNLDYRKTVEEPEPQGDVNVLA